MSKKSKRKHRIEEVDNDSVNEESSEKAESKDDNGAGSGLGSLLGNRKVLYAVILIVVVALAAWRIGTLSLPGPGTTGTELTGSVVQAGGVVDIGEDAVGEKVVNFLQERLEVQYPGITTELKEVTDNPAVPGTYEVLVTITFQNQPQDVPYYVTKDGNSMFANIMDLNEPMPEIQPEDTTQPAVDMAELADDDAVKGDENAPVTIIEFSEYECPYCGRFYSQTLPSIEENYIKTGKVKMIFRDFPLSFHSHAQKASEAAECAGEQGKYYEMHNKLFENGVTGDVAAFKQYAADIGLDTAAFDECLDSGQMADEIAKDISDGAANGVSGTPAFFINGQFVSGAQPFSVFQQVIEQELNK